MVLKGKPMRIGRIVLAANYSVTPGWPDTPGADSYNKHVRSQSASKRAPEMKW